MVESKMNNIKGLTSEQSCFEKDKGQKIKEQFDNCLESIYCDFQDKIKEMEKRIEDNFEEIG